MSEWPKLKLKAQQALTVLNQLEAGGTYPSNDWQTPIDEEKLSTFADQMHVVASNLFGVDCAVEVAVTDRTCFERKYRFPVPYEHKASTPELLAAVEYALLTNLSKALEAVQEFRAMRKVDRPVARKPEPAAEPQSYPKRSPRPKL